MKKAICIFCFLIASIQISFAGIYDLSVPLKGNSIVSNQLQFEIATDLFEQVTKYYPNCTDICISDTQIIHLPYDVKKKKGRYVKGYWKELWTIDACNTKIQMPITFRIKGDKTKYILQNKIDSTMFP